MKAPPVRNLSWLPPPPSVPLLPSPSPPSVVPSFHFLPWHLKQDGAAGFGEGTPGATTLWQAEHLLTSFRSANFLGGLKEVWFHQRSKSAAESANPSPVRNLSWL